VPAPKKFGFSEMIAHLFVVDCDGNCRSHQPRLTAIPQKTLGSSPSLSSQGTADERSHNPSHKP
jgi:hypothetical protein